MTPTCMPITKPWKTVHPKRPTSGTCEASSKKKRAEHGSVYITSDAFKSKMQPARHRMVYSLLKDELAAQGGIHALQLRTRTVEEDEKAKSKEQA